MSKKRAVNPKAPNADGSRKSIVNAAAAEARRKAKPTTTIYNDERFGTVTADYCGDCFGSGWTRRTGVVGEAVTPEHPNHPDGTTMVCRRCNGLGFVMQHTAAL